MGIGGYEKFIKKAIDKVVGEAFGAVEIEEKEVDKLDKDRVFLVEIAKDVGFNQAIKEIEKRKEEFYNG